MGRGFLVRFSEFPDFGFEAEILGSSALGFHCAYQTQSVVVLHRGGQAVPRWSFGRSKIGLRPLPGHSFPLKALISQSSSPYLASTVRRRIDLNQRQAVISLSGCRSALPAPMARAFAAGSHDSQVSHGDVARRRSEPAIALHVPIWVASSKSVRLSLLTARRNRQPVSPLPVPGALCASRRACGAWLVG